jgi:hypothetical protein
MRHAGDGGEGERREPQRRDADAERQARVEAVEAPAG